jgi:hypothetical protein
MADDVVVALRARWQFNPDARFVLCEGDDDKGLLDSIASLPGMPNLQVRYASECNEKHTGGRSGFEHSIREFPIVTNFRRVKGFVFVTDNDNENAFKDTCENLSKNGYKAPSARDGIGELDGRPAKILLLPDSVYGDLEKLCLDVLISKWPRSKACVEAFLNVQARTNGVIRRARIKLCLAQPLSVLMKVIHTRDSDTCFGAGT